MFTQKLSEKIWFKAMSAFLVFAFTFTSTITPAVAQTLPSVLNLPAVGTMVMPTNAFNPVLIKGLTIHPENPLQMDFIVSEGDLYLEKEDFKAETTKLVKYFLAALTTPEEEMWVNLSPYEKDRLLTDNFGDTLMGRDLLAQDYLLKQLTSSLMYPEEAQGQEFWTKVRQRAQDKFGSTDIPLNTFNKIWIVPEKAVVYTHKNNAFVVESKLKVMLEEDYLALERNQAKANASEADPLTGVSLEIVREVLIPAIEEEVNNGETFAPLRQIYTTVILADWYKANLKESLLGQAYVDQGKTQGIDTTDKAINQKIYEQYLESFKTGVYDYIKEEYDPTTQETIPRKYFSGGASFKDVNHAEVLPEDLNERHDLAMTNKQYHRFEVDLGSPDAAMSAAHTKSKEVLTREVRAQLSRQGLPADSSIIENVINVLVEERNELSSTESLEDRILRRLEFNQEWVSEGEPYLPIVVRTAIAADAAMIDQYNKLQTEQLVSMSETILTHLPRGQVRKLSFEQRKDLKDSVESFLAIYAALQKKLKSYDRALEIIGGSLVLGRVQALALQLGIDYTTKGANTDVDQAMSASAEATAVDLSDEARSAESDAAMITKADIAKRTSITELQGALSVFGLNPETPLVSISKGKINSYTLGWHLGPGVHYQRDETLAIPVSIYAYEVGKKVSSVSIFFNDSAKAKDLAEALLEANLAKYADQQKVTREQMNSILNAYKRGDVIVGEAFQDAGINKQFYKFSDLQDEMSRRTYLGMELESLIDDPRYTQDAQMTVEAMQAAVILALENPVNASAVSRDLAEEALTYFENGHWFKITEETEALSSLPSFDDHISKYWPVNFDRDAPFYRDYTNSLFQKQWRRARAVGKRREGGEDTPASVQIAPARQRDLAMKTLEVEEHIQLNQLERLLGISRGQTLSQQGYDFAGFDPESVRQYNFLREKLKKAFTSMATGKNEEFQELRLIAQKIDDAKFKRIYWDFHSVQELSEASGLSIEDIGRVVGHARSEDGSVTVYVNIGVWSITGNHDTTARSVTFNYAPRPGLRSGLNSMGSIVRDADESPTHTAKLLLEQYNHFETERDVFSTESSESQARNALNLNADYNYWPDQVEISADEAMIGDALKRAFIMNPNPGESKITYNRMMSEFLEHLNLNNFTIGLAFGSTALLKIAALMTKTKAFAARWQRRGNDWRKAPDPSDESESDAYKALRDFMNEYGGLSGLPTKEQFTLEDFNNLFPPHRYGDTWSEANRANGNTKGNIEGGISSEGVYEYTFPDLEDYSFKFKVGEVRNMFTFNLPDKGTEKRSTSIELGKKNSMFVITLARLLNSSEKKQMIERLYAARLDPETDAEEAMEILSFPPAPPTIQTEEALPDDEARLNRLRSNLVRFIENNSVNPDTEEGVRNLNIIRQRQKVIENVEKRIAVLGLSDEAQSAESDAAMTQVFPFANLAEKLIPHLEAIVENDRLGLNTYSVYWGELRVLEGTSQQVDYQALAKAVTTEIKKDKLVRQEDEFSLAVDIDKRRIDLKREDRAMLELSEGEKLSLTLEGLKEIERGELYVLIPFLDVLNRALKLMDGEKTHAASLSYSNLLGLLGLSEHQVSEEKKLRGVIHEILIGRLLQNGYVLLNGASRDVWKNPKALSRLKFAYPPQDFTPQSSWGVGRATAKKFTNIKEQDYLLGRKLTKKTVTWKDPVLKGYSLAVISDNDPARSLVIFTGDHQVNMLSLIDEEAEELIQMVDHIDSGLVKDIFRISGAKDISVRFLETIRQAMDRAMVGFTDSALEELDRIRERSSAKFEELIREKNVEGMRIFIVSNFGENEEQIVFSELFMQFAVNYLMDDEIYPVVGLQSQEYNQYLTWNNRQLGDRLDTLVANRNWLKTQAEDSTQFKAVRDKLSADIGKLQADIDRLHSYLKIVESDKGGRTNVSDSIDRYLKTSAEATDQAMSFRVQSEDGFVHEVKVNKYGQLFNVRNTIIITPKKESGKIIAGDGTLIELDDPRLAGYKDQAMGGIDLDPDLFEIETRGDGNLIFPKLKPGMVPTINGLTPTIINVTPIPNLPFVLGLVDSESDTDYGRYPDLDPADRKARLSEFADIDV